MYYEFDDFRFDAQQRTLFRGKRALRLTPKALDTLLILLQNSGKIVEKEELMSALWGSTFVEDVNLAHNISAIRKLFASENITEEFIETVPKRGYRFVGRVRVIPVCSEERSVEQTHEQADSRSHLKIKPILIFVLGGILLGVIGVLAVGWLRAGKNAKTGILEIHSPFDEEEVKRVVKESQIYEALSIYTNPKAFDENQLSKYWVPLDQGGKEIQEVRKAIKRLIDYQQHYGPESKSELFEFRYAMIFAPGDSAEVGTIEKWYVPTYNDDGSRVLDRNVHLGPYQVDYKLRKINGAWLIQENTTPRPRKQ